jgi:DNA-binding transcriptional LysR family regulator
MTRTFDLNLLPVLLAIHEHGSVSLAAQHLGMSQSAVSTALSKLRLKYSDPLFHRVGHGMKPTVRARALVGPLRDAMSQVSTTFSSDARFEPRTTERTFTFAMSDVGEMVFMPKILQRVHQLAPRARLRAVAATAAQIERGLETGEIDLAVGYFPDLKEKSFLEKHLFYHYFVCLLRADHPIKSNTLSLAQFLSLDHAVVSGAGRTNEIFERFLKARKIHRRVVLETPHFMSIPHIIARTDLIVTVPHPVGIFVRDVHMNIRLAQPPMGMPKNDIKMHWHRNFQREPRNKWLREIVAGLFNDDTDEWRVDH